MVFIVFCDKYKFPFTDQLLDTPIAIANYDGSLAEYNFNGIGLIFEDSIRNDFINCWYKMNYWEERFNWFLNDPLRTYHNLGNDNYHITLPGTSEKQLPLDLSLSDELPLVVEYIPSNPCRSENENIMLKLLRKYIPSNINDGWIPFDIDERKKLYPEAFSELERYMKV
jgi:hypothetical protein